MNRGWIQPWYFSFFSPIIYTHIQGSILTTSHTSVHIAPWAFSPRFCSRSIRWCTQGRDRTCVESVGSHLRVKVRYLSLQTCYVHTILIDGYLSCKVRNSWWTMTLFTKTNHAICFQIHLALINRKYITRNLGNTPAAFVAKSLFWSRHWRGTSEVTLVGWYFSFTLWYCVMAHLHCRRWTWVRIRTPVLYRNRD